jgi:plasmid maintenance system killer protein
VHILFENDKTAQLFSSHGKLVREFKHQRAKLIEQRLSELRSADCLSDMQFYRQADCHPLRYGHAGEFAVSLDSGYRLLFYPADDPLPLHPGGNLDWTRVTTICVIGVEDYHD